MTIRTEIARIVADHWRAAALGWGDERLPGRTTAHPLALVVDALDGVTDPVQLGIPTDHEDAARIRALAGDGARRVRQIVVEVPADVDAEGLFEAVADAAHQWEPAERDGWDVDVTGTVVDLPEGSTL